MKQLQFGAALLFLATTASCDGLAPPTMSPVEYQPELSGTVDHAMCLLGFSATPLRRLISGHQLVEGTLNGKPVTFVVDTGANVSVVHARYAETFDLVAQRGVGGAAVGLGGSLAASRSKIQSLKVGASPVRQQHLMVTDLSQLEGVLGRLARQPIHGIIGQDVLREHRAVIDVAKPMLYLREDDSDPAPAPAERCAAQNPRTPV